MTRRGLFKLLAGAAAATWAEVLVGPVLAKTQNVPAPPIFLGKEGLYSGGSCISSPLTYAELEATYKDAMMGAPEDGPDLMIIHSDAVEAFKELGVPMPEFELQRLQSE